MSVAPELGTTTTSSNGSKKRKLVPVDADESEADGNGERDEDSEVLDHAMPPPPPLKKTRRGSIIVTPRSDIQSHIPKGANADDASLIAQVLATALRVADTRLKPSAASGFNPADVSPTPHIEVVDRVHEETRKDSTP